MPTTGNQRHSDGKAPDRHRPATDQHPGHISGGTRSWLTPFILNIARRIVLHPFRPTARQRGGPQLDASSMVAAVVGDIRYNASAPPHAAATSPQETSESGQLSAGDRVEADSIGHTGRAEGQPRPAIGLGVRGPTLAARGWIRSGGCLFEILARRDKAGGPRYLDLRTLPAMEPVGVAGVIADQALYPDAFTGAPALAVMAG